MIGIVGVLGALFLNSINVIIVFRFIMGFSIGGMSGVLPMYLAELAPSDIRGRGMSLNSVSLAIGILLSYIINYIFLDSGDWRVQNLIAVISLGVLVEPCFFILESPSWLMARGEYNEARKISVRMFGGEDKLGSEEQAAIEAKKC